MKGVRRERGHFTDHVFVSSPVFTCILVLPNLRVTLAAYSVCCMEGQVTGGGATGGLWKDRSGRVNPTDTHEATWCDCTRSFISRMQEHISTHGSKTNCIKKLLYIQLQASVIKVAK